MSEPVKEEEEETTGRKQDPEILVLSQVLRKLAELDERACARVVRFIADRYDRSQPTCG